MSVEEYLKKCNCSTVDDLSNDDILAFFKDEKTSSQYFAINAEYYIETGELSPKRAFAIMREAMRWDTDFICRYEYNSAPVIFLKPTSEKMLLALLIWQLMKQKKMLNCIDKEMYYIQKLDHPIFYRKNEFGGIMVSSVYDATLFERKEDADHQAYFLDGFVVKTIRPQG